MYRMLRSSRKDKTGKGKTNRSLTPTHNIICGTVLQLRNFSKEQYIGTQLAQTDNSRIDKMLTV